jgi:aspartyl-tRNA(Asn)/glutamyl-tRNA(Gln) amidotransferase subunit A
MTKISDYADKTATENVNNALKRAREVTSYNALLSLTEERALRRAAKIDSGEITGKLAGVPFVVKDNFLAYGAPTTAASLMLKDFMTPLQATAVEKLEAEGAICIGKANLDAFAHGGSTENSAYGPTKNAVDPTKVAGGSSGGSAVVTALDIVPFALGTDTGGSIRQPASFNGVVGYKPTYGMVSRYGVVAMANSTDSIGCFANTAEDVELLASIMAGRDENDMTSLPDYFKPKQLDGNLKIGVIKELMTDDVDTEVRASVKSAIEHLRSVGHSVEEVSLPIVSHTLAMYYIIVPAEISSNLARYDGVRYGNRSKDASSLSDMYGMTREAGFVLENKRRILIGSYVLSSGYFDAYYQKAQKARTLLVQAFDDLFEEYDILLSPTAPSVAFGFGENTENPVEMYLADAMTVPASLAGLPAISVPVGAGVASTLPIGLQLMAQRRHDAILLALAKTYDKKSETQ